MVEISSLKKQFGETVASDIDALEILDGDILGLVGNNGAGKTTLFRMMLDLLKPDSGQILIDGINPCLSEAWKDFTSAYIDEGFLIDYLTPEEYFSFLGKICGLSQAEVELRQNSFDSFTGGEIFGQKKLIRNLSAGNKQKVGIVAALLRRPRLLILDEPFNFLDPSSQSVLKNVLAEYNRETGATIVISSHNLQHTVEVSTRIVLLEKGRVVSNLSNTGESARESLTDYFEHGHNFSSEIETETS